MRTVIQMMYRVYHTEELAKQLSVVPFFEDLDDWEVITGCHQNRTSVSQLIETSVYFQLVRRNFGILH